MPYSGISHFLCKNIDRNEGKFQKDRVELKRTLKFVKSEHFWSALDFIMKENSLK